MKSILLTGSSGFIGSRFLIGLEKLDCSIKLLSRTNNQSFPTVVCDFLHDEIPSECFHSIDTIFHIAGYAHDTNESAKNKYLNEKINVETTIKLANLAALNKVSHFVFFSSVKAGGLHPNNLCGKEDHQGILYDPYAISKREAEKRLLEIGKTSQMRISVIRPALVYGPNLKGNLKLLWNAISNERFLPIPKVKNRKSMIHIDDLFNAVIMVVKKQKISQDIVNITDGEEYSSRDIYETMCKVQNKQPTKFFLPKLILLIVSYVVPKLRLKINKLIKDECYSSEKLKSYGFIPKKTLFHINETSI
tara:strand:- start:338 stop:1252 length:915 start_codon:yes stop_codon:yes gene_type:complete